MSDEMLDVDALRKLLADGKCLCSSASTDWRGIEDLLDRLREAEVKVARVEAELNERLPCDGCVEYPEETCPRHGRLLTEWLERSDVLQDRVNRVRALADEWQRIGENGLPHGGCLDMHRHHAARIRAALDQPAVTEVESGCTCGGMAACEWMTVLDCGALKFYDGSAFSPRNILILAPGQWITVCEDAE